ncbi:MAG: hypothetical protein ABGX16_19870 [Pirellulales bacterium]
MNTSRMVLAMLGLACWGVVLPGCQRQAAPRFVSSDEVLALTAGLNGEEGDPEELKL